MRFRFQISHEIEGSIEVTQPDAWADAILKLDRHDEFHSLVEYFEGSFILYGDNGVVNGGINFVKLIELNYGPDATILVDIDLTLDEVNYSNVFNGQYKIVDLEEMPNNKMRIPIIRDDFWAKFISRLDTPVNIQSPIDLDGGSRTVVQEKILEMTSQKIRQQFKADLIESLTYFDDGSSIYEQIDIPDITLDEIDTKYNYPVAMNTELPFELFNMVYAGDYVFDIKLVYTQYAVGGNIFVNLSLITYDVYIQINSETPIPLTKVHTSSAITTFTYNDTLSLTRTSQVRLYAFGNDPSNSHIIILGSQGPPSPFAGGAANPGPQDSHIYVTGDTIYPETEAQGFLVHDVGASICDRIIGQDDTFYSELLGSSLTSRQYDEDGCGWAYILLKCLQARLYTLESKPYFQSFSKWWSGVNPILNLSLMYDEIEGQPVIRVEDKAYQYDDNDGTSIDFSNVILTRKYDNNRIFNKVEVGYTQWQSEDISGLDDPQTKKTYSAVFKKIGKALTLFSEFIAASLAIEKARRTTKEKSADYKHDNETFIIAINPDEVIESPDESPDFVHFRPELVENFDSVGNLLNSETRYNLKLTPGRNFLRWMNYIQGALQSYLGSAFKFASGEGNYDMTSEMMIGCSPEDNNGDSLDEKGDIPVTADFLHLPHLYEADIPMEWDEYQTIRDNRRKPIGISQTDTDYVPMFIKELSYKPAKGTCSLLLWPKEFLDLSVLPDTTPMQECIGASNVGGGGGSQDCENGIFDENGFFLTDEFGECITEDEPGETGLALDFALDGAF